MTSVIFPGQGSQYLGMARDFYDNFEIAKNTFKSIEKATNIKISDIIFKNTDKLLDLTQYTQLAIFTSSMAIFNVFKSEVIEYKNIDIDCMLGHSLGEYSALSASGSLSVEDCSKLLKIRGELMQNSYEPNKSGMVAIIGLDCNTIQEIIDSNNLNIEIANDNSPMQIVISGITENLKEAENIFMKFRAKRYLYLNVSAAFHSKIMINAEKKMKKFINDIKFKKPNHFIISNFTSQPSKNVEILKNNLSNQMSNRVRWVESIVNLEKMNEKIIIEIGPGKVLTGLIKRISNNFKYFNIENISDIENIKNEF